MEDKPKNKIDLIDRKYLLLDGVEQVGAFDENEITLHTNMGYLTLQGEGMHITELNLDEGKLTVEGLISYIQFFDNKPAQTTKDKGKSVLARIFK
ncbi:MAG: sporulation protein YabP [Clostridiales bacterium]|nr:sporulation protein YabP [Clostridiales bacterium]MCF8021579.1 sporulation protein YabP [Clostridiales bacterium]